MIPLQIRDFGFKTTKTQALSLTGKAFFFFQNKKPLLLLATMRLSEHFLFFFFFTDKYIY